MDDTPRLVLISLNHISTIEFPRPVQMLSGSKSEKKYSKLTMSNGQIFNITEESFDLINFNQLTL